MSTGNPVPTPAPGKSTGNPAPSPPTEMSVHSTSPDLHNASATNIIPPPGHPNTNISRTDAAAAANVELTGTHNNSTVSPEPADWADDSPSKKLKTQADHDTTTRKDSSLNAVTRLSDHLVDHTHMDTDTKNNGPKGPGIVNDNNNLGHANPHLLHTPNKLQHNSPPTNSSPPRTLSYRDALHSDKVRQGLKSPHARRNTHNQLAGTSSLGLPAEMGTAIARLTKTSLQSHPFSSFDADILAPVGLTINPRVPPVSTLTSPPSHPFCFIPPGLSYADENSAYATFASAIETNNFEYGVLVRPIFRGTELLSPEAAWDGENLFQYVSSEKKRVLRAKSLRGVWSLRTKHTLYTLSGENIRIPSTERAAFSILLFEKNVTTPPSHHYGYITQTDNTWEIKESQRELPVEKNSYVISGIPKYVHSFHKYALKLRKNTPNSIIALSLTTTPHGDPQSFVTCQDPPTLDSLRSAASDLGVSFVPADLFHIQKHEIVVCIYKANASDESLARAARILGARITLTAGKFRSWAVLDGDALTGIDEAESMGFALLTKLGKLAPAPPPPVDVTFTLTNIPLYLDATHVTHLMGDPTKWRVDLCGAEPLFYNMLYLGTKIPLDEARRLASSLSPLCHIAPPLRDGSGEDDIWV